MRKTIKMKNLGMNSLEIIKVGNGTSDFPGNFTKKEEEIIQNAIIGKSANYFSGNSKIGNSRFDLNNKNANFKLDIFRMIELHSQIDLNNLSIIKYDTIIIDAPYNSKFAEKYAKLSEKDISKQFIIFADSKKTTILFDYIRNIQKPKRIIIKSWNYYILKGYQLTKGYLCYAGGYRKSTFLLIMDKV